MAEASGTSTPNSNFPVGKRWIEVTPTPLNWGCVKVNECSVQQAILKNTSQSVLHLQVTATGPRFTITSSETIGNEGLWLQPLQSRILSVFFCPDAARAFYDELVIKITPAAFLQNFTGTRQNVLHTGPSVVENINLYGYGGHACVELQVNGMLKYLTTDTFNFTINRPWYKVPQVSGVILFQNSGDLPGFVYVQYQPVNRLLPISLFVSLNQFVIQPGSNFSMTVFNTPTSAEQNQMKCELGVLRFYTGSEFLRGRLKRLASKARESGYQVGQFVNKLASTFAFEQPFPNDLYLPNDEFHNINKLVNEITVKTVFVSVVQDI